jgi:hypothetical protein
MVNVFGQMSILLGSQSPVGSASGIPKRGVGWEWKVQTRELDERWVRWTCKQRRLLILQYVAAQEEALMGTQLYPLRPAIVRGVLRLRKCSNDLGNTRGGDAEVFTELLLVRSDLANRCVRIYTLVHALETGRQICGRAPCSVL